MFRKILGFSLTLIFIASVTAGADTAPVRSNLSASEIVSKNVAARGGLQAWRAVQTMSIEGKLGVGGNQRAPVPVPVPGKKSARMPIDKRLAEEAQLSFVMKMERSRKLHFELQFNGQTAVQVFDGVNGWKFRPYLNRSVVEPYTNDELKGAAVQSDIDGPLVDYAVKGTRVDLEGTEKVEDRDTYKLKLTMNDGHSIHVWIDAKTFLEAKIEGQPRRLDGIDHPVEIYYRDYRAVNGLQIPFVQETVVLPVAKTVRIPGLVNGPIPSEKIIIDKVEVNPKLDASLFVKPQVATAAYLHP